MSIAELAKLVMDLAKHVNWSINQVITTLKTAGMIKPEDADLIRDYLLENRNL